MEWANEALQGLGKGAPFSLFLTNKHFSAVASAVAKNDVELSTVSTFFGGLGGLRFPCFKINSMSILYI